MGYANWNIQQLKTHLSQRKEVKGWILVEEHLHRKERYLMAEAQKPVIDQDRDVKKSEISIKLFVNLGNPSRQGEISKKLFTALPIPPQIDQAIQSALQTDHQSWELPTQIPPQIPNWLTSDPAILEDIDRAMDSLTSRIYQSLEKKRPTAFNSAELFLSIHHRDLHLSNGLTHRSTQSRIYTETAFSCSKEDPKQGLISDEYLNTCWSVNLDQMPIEKIIDHSSFCAERSLDVTKPITGKYSVIIDAEVLSNLLNGHISHLSATHIYNSLPSIQPGNEFIPQAKGDLLSITLDPTLEFGADTAAISDQGLVQKPLKLVDQNQVVASIADKQYADYLGKPPTTVRGNLVVEPGKLSYDELTQQAPQVIEILQFSGLFTDSNNGTFSSEIRLARFFDNEQGKVYYLKGGSLSGSVTENFRNLKLSHTQAKRSHFSSDSTYGQGYLGPEYALLTEVSIVG